MKLALLLNRLRRRLAPLCLLPVLSGCLIDDPPAYRAPQRTVPHINGLRALPRLDEMIIYTATSAPIDFSIPISSEDVGDKVEARLFFNYVGLRSELAELVSIPPSTLDEGERTLKMSWSPRLDIKPGCHRVTLRVSHASNWRDKAELVDPSDLDEAYWFAKIYVDPQNSTGVVECPTASSVTQ